MRTKLTTQVNMSIRKAFSLLVLQKRLLMDFARHFFLNIFMRGMFLFSCDCTCIGCLKLRGKRREG